MTDAAKSKYQTTPWQPTVDTSNGDEKKAGEDYTDVYGGTPTYGKPTDDGDPQAPIGNIPVLTAAYTTAPDFVPTQGKTDGSSNNDTSMGSKGAFKIDLGALKTSEQSFLNATTAAVNAYETLKPTVTNAINSPDLFGQMVGSVSSNSGYTTLSAGGWGTTTNMDPLDSEGTEFAASIGPELHNLMVSAAGVIELMGAFSAMLNNAGQMYTYTDSSAAFTDLP
jgi:hypothetical protein